MTVPRPTSIRLVARSAPARTPSPPFGIAGWSADAQAMAVLLDPEGLEANNPAPVAAQLPPAADLPPSTIVFVLGAADRPRGFRRWLGRPLQVSRAARCTALVALGYVCVGATTDDATGADLSWGLSSLY